MAKKKKQKRISQSQQLEIAERELDKGNAKQALKLARVCYRVDRSEPVRSLFQKAILSRGRELHAHAMLEPARAVVAELDDLGEVAAEFQADANRLRVLLGLQRGVESPELEDKGLQAELADQSVLLGSAATRNGARNGAMAETAETIRAALSAAEAGEFERAVELVMPIGRDSPYCDWKLLVRGLCAYYQHDEQKTTANWSRLAQERAPRRIADTLSLLMDSRRYADASGSAQARADRLIRSIEPPLIGSLRVLRRKFHEPDSDPSEERAELRRFMNSHAKAEPAVAQRVANIFIERAIKQEDYAGLKAIKRYLPKLPLDPHLHRANALLAESDGDLSDLSDLSDVEEHWLKYIDDLETCESLTESQRVLAKSLIYFRLAERLVGSIVEVENDRDFAYFDNDDIEGLELDAISFFRKSLEANPNSSSAHLALARFLRGRQRPNEAAAAFREIGRRFPDDVDSMIAVATYFISSDEPGVAKEYAKKARALRPRDPQTVSLVWSSCLATAREATKQRQFRLAEAELDEAESLLDAGTLDAYILSSLRAAVAFKEVKLDAAERHLKQTIKLFEQPTAALLLVDSQARRCNVDGQYTKATRDRLAKALKGRKNSQAAGVMSKYLHALAVCDVEYKGIVTHCKQVEEYLSRCSRVKWQADQLVEACRFASLEDTRHALLEKLAKRGIDLFPRHPYFQFFAGLAEMSQGPSRCNVFAARTAFERAIELNKQGDIPLEDSYCRKASHSLSLLQNGPLPGFGPLGPFGAGYEFDEDQDPLQDIDPAMLEQILESMPAELKEILDQRGMSPLDALRVIAAMAGR